MRKSEKTQYVKPVEVLCATDGGSVLYVGRFYELMKVKAMTLY